MKGQPMEHQYLRHLAIESNLLELTFALTPKVSPPAQCPRYFCQTGTLSERNEIDPRWVR